MKNSFDRFDKRKKLNQKAFTLIEVLGVIVIIGILLIIVFPSLSKMIRENNNKKMSNYYDIIEEATKVYAAKLTDKLGTNKHTGCAEITLDDLIESGYLQKFEDEKVTCKTGNNNIKIRNDQGAITVNFQLSCSKGRKNVYVTGQNDNQTCDAYVESNEQNLKSVLAADENLETSSNNNEIYLIGNPNNYVWYSGKMWRVVSYDAITETTKLVTANPITSIYYNTNNKYSYYESDVYNWLNNEFYNSLKEPTNFIIKSNWVSPDEKTTQGKVGLLTKDDFEKIKNWYGTSTSWLLSEGTGGIGYYSSNEVKTISTKTILGLRPVIVLDDEVICYEGEGTINNPYIIDNSKNATGKPEENIYTRYSGEYVILDGKKYRIVSTSGNITKIISMFSVGDYKFDDADNQNDGYYLYSTSNIRENLEANYSNIATYLTNGDFCMDTINGGNATYRFSMCLTQDRLTSAKVGLPQIGDLFTTNIPEVTKAYWTLNPNTEKSYSSIMNLISPTGTISTNNATISSSNSTVVVLYLASDVKIKSGTGTNANPYELVK